MLNASDLLRLTIFEHHHILDVQRWIVMAVGIRGSDRETHFLGEHFHGFLAFGFGFDGRSGLKFRL